MRTSPSTFAFRRCRYSYNCGTLSRESLFEVLTTPVVYRFLLVSSSRDITFMVVAMLRALGFGIVLECYKGAQAFHQSSVLLFPDAIVNSSSPCALEAPSRRIRAIAPTCVCCCERDTVSGALEIPPPPARRSASPHLLAAGAVFSL